MSNELNETVLESVLVQLPGLLGLHVVGCSKVDHVAVLRLVSHTPLLEDLSFTTTVSRLILLQKIALHVKALLGKFPRSHKSPAITLSPTYPGLRHSLFYGPIPRPDDCCLYSRSHQALLTPSHFLHHETA